MIQKKLFMAAIMLCCGISCNAQTAKHEEQCTAECCEDQKPTSNAGSIDKPVITMETTTTKKVIACKLTSPELQQRKEEVLAALKLKVLDRQELTNGYKYKFEGSDNLLDELIVFIKSERACCDFFTFNLSISDNQSNTWLSITGPDGAKDFIRMEMDL